MMRTCRVAGSATGLMRVMRPVNCRVRIAVHREVHRRADAHRRQLLGRHRRLEPHARRIDDGEQRGARLNDVARVHRAARSRCRRTARLIVALSSCFCAFASCACALASCACAAEYWLRASSTSRSAIAPALSSVSLRSTWRLAMSAVFCAVVTAERADSSASRSAASSMRASGCALARRAVPARPRLQHRAADFGANRRLLFRRERAGDRRPRANLLRLHDRDVLRSDEHRRSASSRPCSCRRPCSRDRGDGRRAQRARDRTARCVRMTDSSATHGWMLPWTAAVPAAVVVRRCCVVAVAAAAAAVAVAAAADCACAPLLRRRAVVLERQVAQQREAHARDGEIARRLRAVRQRLLEQEPRLREIRLRRDALAIAHLVDRVGALRLLRRAAARVQRRLRFARAR